MVVEENIHEVMTPPCLVHVAVLGTVSMMHDVQTTRQQRVETICAQVTSRGNTEYCLIRAEARRPELFL